MRIIKTAVHEAIQRQLDLYPESSLKDIYKSFYQDEFGPGHLLASPESARIYFEQELGSMKSRGRCSAEPCGNGRNFCRIPMDLVLDGVIPEDVYFSAFISGASKFKLPGVDEWKRKWKIILGILSCKRHLIEDFEQDSAEIYIALEAGNCVMHHSTRYRRAYDPHYRILSLGAGQDVLSGQLG